MKNFNVKKKRLRIGAAMRKILLLLEAGLALGLTHRPDTYFKILKSVKKEWQKIDRVSLHRAIRSLYKSKLINSKENEDDSVTMTLSEKGKLVTLRYNIEKLRLPKLDTWDGLWRMVIFDIPEVKKKTRDAISFKLKQLGFHPLQKSVFVYPYECQKEIDFLTEFFEIRPYIRFMKVKETDVDLYLKDIFKLRS